MSVRSAAGSFVFVFLCGGLFAGLAGAGCDNEPEGENGNGDDGIVSLGATAHGACGESIGLGENVDKRDDREEWCAAERLTWSYDEAIATLTLLHSRVALNCCADHSVSYEQVGEIHVITEVDVAPRDGRCRCTCLFDFRSSLEGIGPGTMSLLLLLDVEESEGAEVVWEGELDLLQGSGVIVLDDTQSPYCDVF